MQEAWFALKILILSVLIVLVLQIKFGSKSLEDHTLTLAARSGIVESLQGVVKGTTEIFGDIKKRIEEQK